MIHYRSFGCPAYRFPCHSGKGEGSIALSGNLLTLFGPTRNFSRGGRNSAPRPCTLGQLSSTPQRLSCESYKDTLRQQESQCTLFGSVVCGSQKILFRVNVHGSGGAFVQQLSSPSWLAKIYCRFGRTAGNSEASVGVRYQYL